MAKKFEQKKYSPMFCLVIIFGVSILLRFYLAIKTGAFTVYADEPVYWEWSKELWRKMPLNYRGGPSVVKDVLYPWLLSVAHLWGDFGKTYHTMLLINVLLISSVVFPAYLLADAVLRNKKLAIFIAVFSVAVPELFYSSKLLQENLYYPYVMWTFYLFFKYLLEDKYSIKRVAVFSIKGIGHCLVLAFFLFYIIQILFLGSFKQKRKSTIVLLEAVLICFGVDYLIDLVRGYNGATSMIIDIIVRFRGVVYNLAAYSGLTFSQIIGVLVVASFALLALGVCMKEYTKKKYQRQSIRLLLLGVLAIFLVGAVWTIYHLGYLNSCITYAVFSCIFWGIFPVIFPLIYVKELEERERDLLLFITLIWLLILTAVCFSFTTTATSDSQTLIWMHYRYFYYPLIPFLVIFLSLFDKLQKKGITFRYIKWNIICALLLIAVIPPTMGSKVDAVPLYALQYFFASRNGIVLFKIMLVLYLIWGAFAVWKRHIKLLYNGTFFLMGCLCFFSTVKAYQTQMDVKVFLAGKERDGIRLEGYFQGIEGIKTEDDVLVVADSWMNDTEVTEAYLDVPYRLCIWQELISPDTLVDGKIQGTFLNFHISDWPYRLEGYSAPKYIITLHPLILSGYDIEEIGLENYYLYVRADA